MAICVILVLAKVEIENMNKLVYRGTSFNVPSCRRFWDNCGRFDSIIEFQECAHSDFKVSYMDAYSRDGISMPDYVNKRSAELNIYLGHFNEPNYEDSLYGCYLISPMSCFETFLEEFVKDLKLLGFKKAKINPRSTQTKFQQVQKIFKINGINVRFEPWNKDIFEYFRLRRNAVAHGLESSHYQAALAKAATWRVDIKARYSNFGDLLDTGGHLSFYDFLLCTTNVKNMGDLMTLALENKVNWRKVGKSHPKYINYKLINGMDKSKKIEYIRKCVQNMYSIQLSDTQCMYFL